MLKRFCNKCNKEISENESYYSITMNHVGKDPVVGAFDISDKAIAMDMCEECFNSIMSRKEETDD